MEMLTILLDLLNITFFYQTNGAFPLFSLMFNGLGSGKILSSHSFRFFFPYFSNGYPLSIFHLPPLHLSSSPDLLKSHLTQSFDLSCSFPFSCILDVFSPFSSTLFSSMSASILTMWPTHFTLLLTNLPVELFCCITYFLRSFILLSSTLFVRVIRQNQNQPCSCCCCSVNATVSRYRLRHACVTHALRTFLFSFFKMFLSTMTPSTFPRAFAPCCIRHRISTSECSSSLTIPPSYIKPSTWLNSLSSKVMFKSSL